MSFHYGSASRARLQTAHPDLVAVFESALWDVDITILCGARGATEQDYLYDTGASRVRWPDSLHNITPERRLAHAIDFAPYPINWGDAEKFRAVAFYLRGIGRGLGVELRLGADWNSDFHWSDNGFHDLGHVELANG